MANIPTIPGTEAVQNVPIGQKLDPRMGLELQGQVAKTFDTAVGAIADYEENKQKAEENYVQNASTLSFHKMAQDFRDQINKGMPDDQIVPNWENQVQEWKSQQLSLYGDKLTPQSRAFMENAWNQGAISTRGEFQLVAEHKAIQRRRGALHALGREFENSGDEQQGEMYGAALDRSAEFGDISEEERDVKKAMIPQRVQTAQALHGINSDQLTTLDTLKKLQGDGFPQIKDENERRRLISFAQTKIRSNQGNYVETLSDKMSNSPTQTLPQKEIDDARDNQLITARAWRSLTYRNKRVDNNVDKNQAALIESDLIDSDFVKAENRDSLLAEYKDRIASIHSPQLRNQIKIRLMNKYGAAEKQMASDEKPEIQTQLTAMKQDFDSGTAFVPMTQGKPASSGFFTDTPAEPPKHVLGGIKAIEKMSDDDFKANFGADTKRADVIEAARLNYSIKQKQFLDIVHRATAQQLADPNWLNDQRNLVERGDAMNAVKSTLAVPSGSMRTFNSPQEVRDAKLPPNTPYLTPDGKVRYSK